MVNKFALLIVKLFPVQVEDVKVVDSKITSQTTQNQGKNEQSSKPKE